MKKYSLSISVLLLTSCSMPVQQTQSKSSTIRIIKEQPQEQVTYERKYKSKIVNVDYNSSIITPELTTEHHKNNNYNNRITKSVNNKVSSSASSLEREADAKIDNFIDNKISSLLN